MRVEFEKYPFWEMPMLVLKKDILVSPSLWKARALVPVLLLAPLLCSCSTTSRGPAPRFYHDSIALTLQNSGKTPGPKGPAATNKQDEKKAGDTLKSFKEVIKDATKIEGMFTLYRKEDQLYLEIRPEQLGRLYLFLPTLFTSVDAWRVSGSYLEDKVFYLDKQEKKVNWVWKNLRYQSGGDSAAARSLNNIVPNSIYATAKVECEPDSESKAILISLNDIFFADIANLESMFTEGDQTTFRIDRGRTAWGPIKAFPKNLELEVTYTLSASKPVYSPYLADSRALTVRTRFSLSELPQGNGFVPRVADDRVGYFTSSFLNFDFDPRRTLEGPLVKYITRWDLRPKSPGDSLSEPEQPIVFWIENTVPPRLRPAVRDGILEWNKAFARIGFKDAIVVKEMPDTATWDPADVRYNTVRWVTSLSGQMSFAFGPSRANPLTGQILDADVVVLAPELWLFYYNLYARPWDQGSKPHFGMETQDLRRSLWAKDNLAVADKMDFGILAMLARGEIRDPADVPEEFIYRSVRSLVTHEIGHTLGLRHNFKGSSTIAIDQLQDTTYTTEHSIGNSVMDYLPINLAPPGIKQGDFFERTIGAWDYWAIEYGYRPIAATSPDSATAELRRIAARSGEKDLAYGTDEDAYDWGPYAASIDPTSAIFDLSNDPLGWSEGQIELVKMLWENLQKRSAFPGYSYETMRRAMNSTMGHYFSSNWDAVKWIGGIYHVRGHVGDPQGRDPFQVVDGAIQRRALALLIENMFSTRPFSFDPNVLNKLQAPRDYDPLNWETFYQDLGAGRATLDYSPHRMYRSFVSGLLSYLYDPLRLQRLLENEQRFSPGAEKFTLAEYMNRTDQAMWTELTRGMEVNSYRRILQREYVQTLTGLVLKPPAPCPDDAVALSRHLLRRVHQKIGSYLKKNPQADLATTAHLQDLSNEISQTLRATITRTVP